MREIHARFDAAIPAAYGFSATRDLLQQLPDLNCAVAAKIPEGTQSNGVGDTAMAPGVPLEWRNDCLQIVLQFGQFAYTRGIQSPHYQGQRSVGYPAGASKRKGWMP